LTLPPRQAAALRFKVEVAEGENPGKDFNLRLIGRARWADADRKVFESNYIEQQGARLQTAP
jgi:hypothetical protein